MKARPAPTARATTRATKTSDTPAVVVPPVDIAPIAAALNTLAGQLARFMGSIEHLEHEQHELMEKLDEQNRQVMALAEREYPAPQVTVRNAKRARVGYDVVLVRDEVDNELLGFRLRPTDAEG